MIAPGGRSNPVENPPPLPGSVVTTSSKLRAIPVGFAIFGAIALLLYSLRPSTTSAVPKAGAPDSNPASLAEIRALTEEARKASLDGDDQKAINLTAESARKLEAAAATSKGSDRVVMEYAAELAKSQNEILKKYIDAAGAYSHAGGGDLAGLSDAASVESRLRPLNEAIVAHERVMDYFQTIEERIPKELGARGVRESDVTQFLSGFAAKANTKNLLAIHHAEHAILLASRARLDLLKSHAGRWTVDDSGTLMTAESFPPKDLAEFNRLGDEIHALASKQGVLVQERKSGG